MCCSTPFLMLKRVAFFLGLMMGWILPAVAQPGGPLPIIRLQPISIACLVADGAGFSVRVYNSSSVTYQWSKNGVPIAGATNSSFSIASTVTNDAGTYAVVVTNAQGSTVSLPATLVILPQPAPTIVRLLSYDFAYEGSQFGLSANLSGANSSQLRWEKNGVSVTGDSIFNNTPAPDGDFYRRSAVAGDAGLYTAVVTTPAGTVMASTTVTILPARPPEFIYDPPATVSVVPGGMLVLNTTAVPQIATYQWFKNGAPIADATGAQFYKSNVQPADAGTYFVVATNPTGSVTSRSSTVTIDPAAARPVIVSAGGGGVYTPSNFIGTSLSIETSVSNATFQWKKDGVAISGATEARLMLASTGLADEGTYTAAVTTPGGTVTSPPYFLRVKDKDLPLRILRQPAANQIKAGDLLYFRVTFEGEGPVTYQWRRDGVNIPGGALEIDPANTMAIVYRVSGAMTASAGSYSVVINNRNGSITSADAVVTVAPTSSAPIIIGHPASQAIEVDSGAATLSVYLLDSTNASYQWRKMASTSRALPPRTTFSTPTTAASPADIP